MRCDGIELDNARKFGECRADSVENLRGLGESFASRTVELENFVQSQLAGYREQFISIDHRFGKMESRLGAAGVAPSLVGQHVPLPQRVMHSPPMVSQSFVQQAASVPVPVSDGQSFRSYMSWDEHRSEEHHSASSGRMNRTLERQRPVIPRESGC